MSVLDRLQFYLVHFILHYDVVPGRPQGQWVDIPIAHFDPAKDYKEYVDELVSGDKLGYDALVVNEHRSTFYSLMPSRSVMAGALAVLAVLTERAKICVFGTPISLTYLHRLAKCVTRRSSFGENRIV